MHELLSKAVDPNVPVKGQGFYELSLLEEGKELGARYCVRWTYTEWSEIDGQVMWDTEEADYFWILNEAKRRYAERRLALAEKGYIYSNMDSHCCPGKNVWSCHKTLNALWIDLCGAGNDLKSL